MPSRQQLEKSAWDWVDSTEPQNVNQSHIFKAYRLDIAPCKSGTCRYKVLICIFRLNKKHKLNMSHLNINVCFFIRDILIN